MLGLTLHLGVGTSPRKRSALHAPVFACAGQAGMRPGLVAPRHVAAIVGTRSTWNDSVRPLEPKRWPGQGRSVHSRFKVGLYIDEPVPGCTPPHCSHYRPQATQKETPCADSTDRDKQTVPTEPEKKLVQHIASNQADSRQYRQNPKKN